MAAKKRPLKSVRPPRRSVRRTEAPPPLEPVQKSPLTEQLEIAPDHSIPYLPIFIAVALVAALAWWTLRHKNPGSETAAQAPGVPAAAAAPQADPTRAAASPMVSARPVLPRPPTDIDEPRLSGGRHAIESGGGNEEASSATAKNGTLRLSLGAGKPLILRCWRDAGAPARLDIFGQRNHRVRAVLSAPGPQGWLELSWDGHDETGALVPRGEYYALPSQKTEQLVLNLKVKN